jgi:hypothetical protein
MLRKSEFKIRIRTNKYTAYFPHLYECYVYKYNRTPEREHKANLGVGYWLRHANPKQMS